nr:reverse transcriptase domain, reverse transcriptase zinc-binding domain protein [Tanacetum cinerariifolium]
MRGWIRACLYSVRTSILINDSPTKEFSIKRGLRQGDPLSPFLFILVMEGLHVAIKEASQSWFIKGVSVGNSNFNLSHLFYVDNVVIVSDWDKEDMDNIIQVLNVFYLAFRLKININKSNVYGVGVSTEEIESMASLIGCSPSSLPFNYLGVPIGANMNKIGDNALNEGYNGLFRLDVNEDSYVVDRWSVNGWNWHWCRPNEGGRTGGMLAAMMDDIQNINLNSGSDSWQ